MVNLLWGVCSSSLAVVTCSQGCAKLRKKVQDKCIPLISCVALKWKLLGVEEMGGSVLPWSVASTLAETALEDDGISSVLTSTSMALVLAGMLGDNVG